MIAAPSKRFRVGLRSIFRTGLLGLAAGCSTFGGEPEWDFKWVTSFPNYTEFGKAYQNGANGGGRQKDREIFGDMLECDASRVYYATTVRRVTAEMDDE